MSVTIRASKQSLQPPGSYFHKINVMNVICFPKVCHNTKFETSEMALVSLPSHKFTDGHVGTIDHRRLKGDQDGEISSDLIYLNPVSQNLVSVYNTVSFFCRFLRKNCSLSLGFEVLTAASMKMAVFWVVAPCSLVEVCRRFRGAAASIIRAKRSLRANTHRPDDGGSTHL
jgi:hypothetical protein